MITKAIKYGTPWCGPCKVTEENLKKIGIPFESINVDENEEIAEKKNIRSVPVTEFYDENGALVLTEKGLLTIERIKDILDSAGNKADIKRT